MYFFIACRIKTISCCIFVNETRLCNIFNCVVYFISCRPQVQNDIGAPNYQSNNKQYHAYGIWRHLF